MDGKKMGDFANNPFVALFQDVDTAKKFAEGTSLALGQMEQSQPIASNEMGGEDDTMMPMEEEGDEGSTSQLLSTPSFNKDFLINDFLQRIFLITIDVDEKNHGIHQFGGLPSNSIKLCELREECEDNSSYLLSLQNINQALYERLQIANPSSLLLTRSGYSGKTTLECCETRLVKYLAACYCRINQEEDAINYILSSTSGKYIIGGMSEGLEDEVHKVANDCRKLVTSFTGTVLLQAEIFPVGKQPHMQLLEVLTNAFTEPHLYEYALKLIESHKDEDDLSLMFTPVLDNMWKLSEQFAVLHPDVFPLLNILLLFSQSQRLTWCLLKSKYWLPLSQHDGRFQYIGSAFEYETILGRFLRITSIPLRGGPSELYLKPSTQSESDMNAITNNIRQYLDTLVTMLHKFLHNLFQLPDVKHDVLLWIGLCLNANIKRSQMYTDPTIVAGSGFFLNLTQVLLKFCEPFCLPNSKLLFKVDCRYGGIVSTPDSIMKSTTLIHAVGLDKYTPMVPKREDMPAVKINGTKFNFISELFFLTHLCYKLGFVKMYEQYEELMKRLRKLSDVYLDAQRQGNIAGVVDNFRNDFENGMRTQLAVKAHLLTPALADLALKFSTSSGYWLVQQVLASDEYVISKHRELDTDVLGSDIPPALTVIPEFVAENVGDTIKAIGNFNEESLERCQHLPYLMNFFAVFLGGKNRMQNPHLRAKLAECLSAFLPKDKDGLSRTNHFSSCRQKAFEISPILIKILPQSLLQLFVDIEFTGHTMEFDQKFMYRRYMYSILEYIWQIPAYLSVFRDLYKNGKVMYNKEKVLSTFPRFINLLVNDSTFLLDEALQHLVTIRGLEQEKANGDWEELSDEEKKERQKNLTQCGHMAEGYNTMAKETVHVICYITKELDRPFVSHIMADSMAAFLNYFFVHLVGPKRKQLKVNDFEKYNFDPGHLVKNITKIYLQLGKHEDFCQAIAKDSRSYTPELFESAVEVLERLEASHDMAIELRQLSERLKAWNLKLTKAAEEMPEPPEEYVDPISCELMQEPVQLPSSGKIICRSTIAKHLLSDEKDPFNRSPLQLDQVIPCTDLQEKIRQWMKDNFVEPPLYSSDD